MTDAEDLIAQLIDKVTLEPWVAESGDVWTGESGRHGIPILRGDRGHDRRWGRPLSEEEAEAIVSYVAGCSPANIRALLDSLRTAERERDEARQIVRDVHWMAIRYADGRRSYAPGMCNDALRKAYDGGWLKYTPHAQHDR